MVLVTEANWSFWCRITPSALCFAFCLQDSKAFQQILKSCWSEDYPVLNWGCCHDFPSIPVLKSHNIINDFGSQWFPELFKRVGDSEGEESLCRSLKSLSFEAGITARSTKEQSIFPIPTDVDRMQCMSLLQGGSRTISMLAFSEGSYKEIRFSATISLNKLLHLFWFFNENRIGHLNLPLVIHHKYP